MPESGSKNHLKKHAEKDHRPTRYPIGIHYHYDIDGKDVCVGGTCNTNDSLPSEDYYGPIEDNHV